MTTQPSDPLAAERENERREEIAWLIEQDAPHGSPVWFTATGPEWRFSRDANDALRFARKADAETFIRWLGGNPLLSNPRATEHMWIGGERMTWADLEDDIADAIQDSIDMDWSSRDGAKAVVKFLDGLALPPLPQQGEAEPVEALAAAIYNANPCGDQETDLDGRPTGPGYVITWDQMDEYAPKEAAQIREVARLISEGRLSDFLGRPAEAQARVEITDVMVDDAVDAWHANEGLLDDVLRAVLVTALSGSTPKPEQPR